jgi:hypothetical protein
MKMAVFWVVAPCSLVEVYRRFRGTCCLHHQGPILDLFNASSVIRTHDSSVLTATVISIKLM